MSISLRKEQSVDLTQRISSKMSSFWSKKVLSVDFKLTRGSKDVDRFHLERSKQEHPTTDLSRVLLNAA